MGRPFERTSLVEAKGMAILSPFLEERADGKLVVLNKGPLARALQETVGDMVFTASDGSARSVEVKVEGRHTGNLFLETWSNKNLDDRENHTAIGSNVGWLHKCRADLLFYYFLDADSLYVLDMIKLQRWAFGHAGRKGRLYEFEERKQGKWVQRNDTWGCCVPLTVLKDEVRFRLFWPKQLEFWDEDVVARVA